MRETSTRRLVALEISGTDDGDGHARMRQKLAQVTLAPPELRRELCEMVANVETNLGLIPVVSAARYQLHDEAA